jgi:hypothetical protein
VPPREAAGPARPDQGDGRALPGAGRAHRRRRGRRLPGGLLGLAVHIEHYGEAIEYDLWDRRDDIRHYLNGRKPLRRLANILRRLPGDSHYVTAKRNDPLIAEHVANAAAQVEDKANKYTPPPTEWSVVAELLAANFDRLGEVVRAVTNGYAKDPNTDPIRPYPRPVTEIALDDLISQAQATYRRNQNREG